MSGADSRRSTARPGRKAEATRQALLDAARVVFARDGYANARIVDIAKQAGRSVGVFYRYFDDKPALFGALLESFHQEMVRITRAPPAFEDDTPVAVRSALTGFWSTYRRYHPEMLGLLETGLTDPAVLEVWRKMRKRGIRRFAFGIRKQQERGRCRGVDPDLAASALHGMLEFTCFNWHSGKLDYPDGAVGDEQAVETLYRLVATTLELDEPRTSARGTGAGRRVSGSSRATPPRPARRR